MRLTIAAFAVQVFALAMTRVSQSPPSPPETRLQSPRLAATIRLPDPTAGYYRGTRFDWAGVIASLRWHDHEYFGQWFDRYDPTIHDAITGPVEEFLTNDSGLGYDEARPGDTFVRIGV